MTLVAAYRDVLRVISTEEGTKYDENLGPVIEEAGDLSQPLGEIWTDELPAYQQMDTTIEPSSTIISTSQRKVFTRIKRNVYGRCCSLVGEIP